MSDEVTGRRISTGTTAGSSRSSTESATSRPPTVSPRTGRPQDQALTQRLRDDAVALVVDSGFKPFSYERLAKRTGAGKAGIYRRWPDTVELMIDALATCQLVPRTPSTGSLTGDVRTLLQSFTRELTVQDKFAGSLIGPSRHLPALADALHSAVAAPLAAATQAITTAHDARHPGTHTDPRLTTHLIQALWWARLISTGPPWTPARLSQCVEAVARCVAESTMPRMASPAGEG
ncbi:TetR/AcrR family transcriptional regulator [Klenkia sp. PcliD-1-E]|uniref:TetR/AcrR family transcriptional regulator n=1 Tax=Klenkia sp. PcliD-1-E TaxID=2954492 RepID=UPI0020971CDF|nr:TetR/AcrR family transcriptional regulator [Klenkia sp. PcliD-1-E]MCO7218337.1 TetR/AcrR family transcriptional regulator [Klenkia sp. PcliD-1-E]